MAVGEGVAKAGGLDLLGNGGARCNPQQQADGGCQTCKGSGDVTFSA